MRDRTPVILGSGLVVFVAVAVIVVVIALSSNTDPGDSSGTSTDTAEPVATTATTTMPAGPNRLMEMERNGELHAMLQQHQEMMQRMQVDASPQMLEIMRNDPMWQMLDSGEMITLMEEHQEDINRMLAQPGG